MTTIQERLDQLIKSLGYKKAIDFANRIGEAKSKISSYLSGKVPPGTALVTKIITSFPNVNSNWLLTGNGNMYLSEYESTQNPILNTSRENPTILLSGMTTIEQLVQQNCELIKQVGEGLAIQHEMVKVHSEMAHTQRVNAEAILALSKKKYEPHNTT